MRVDKKYIQNLQGKDFILFTGLLDLAHQDGLKRVNTEILQIPTDQNGRCCIVRAEVETEKGVFSGIGDADPSNVNKMISKHLIRMAETRAVARALRVATNVGITAFEELGGDDSDPEPVRKQQKQAQPKQQTPLASAEQKATIQKLAVCLGWSADRLKKFLAKGGTDLGSINTLQADKAAQNMQKAIFQPKEFGEFATDDQMFEIDGLQKSLGWDGKRLNSFLAQVNLSAGKLNKHQADWVIWQLSKIQANQRIPA